VAKRFSEIENGFGAHGHQCSLYFQNFENFIHTEGMYGKNPIKKYIIFWEYKKYKLLRANSSKIILPLTHIIIR
jgi:hypothetical protein